jgi:hypothetical protein
VVIHENSLEHEEEKNQLVQIMGCRGRMWVDIQNLADGDGDFIPITDTDTAGLPAADRTRCNAVEEVRRRRFEIPDPSGI